MENQQDQINSLKAEAIVLKAMIIAQNVACYTALSKINPDIAKDYYLDYKKRFDSRWKKVAADSPELAELFDKLLDGLLPPSE